MSVHWAGGRFNGWALMSFQQTWRTVPGARTCWLTQGRIVFPSRVQVSWRALGYPGSLTAPWTMGCSSGLIIQNSWNGQSAESCCMSLSGSPGRSLETLALSPHWPKVIRTSRAPHHSLSWHPCCNYPPVMQQDCLYHSPRTILPVRCHFSVSTEMFLTHFQSAGNATEFWSL